ncbi:MAG: superoxide dismutase [Phycisphaerales bacterium]|nr:superoxide dismutase [Phycisphaerales bacterium]
MAVGVESAVAQPGGEDPKPTEPYSLAPLPYDYADLEPHIDAQTMKLHHDIHHAGYVKNANAALAELTAIRVAGGDQLARVRAVTEALSFNLSGHLLHTVFWTNMSKSGGGDPAADGMLAGMLRRDFGSVDSAWKNFSAAAAQVHGSGWGILAYEPHAKHLMVLQAEKHQNVTVWGVVPLLVLDVWEHAYYLKYQNKRTAYIDAFRNVVNWEDVDRRLRAAAGA